MFKKGHNWVLRYCEDDPLYQYWCCSQCGVDNDKAERDGNKVCLRFSWLVYWQGKVRQKRRELCKRLGRLILKLSR